MDPSGYVYEAVPSNRLAGVTTTVYYSAVETGDDPVKWDAEDYDQKNPLITDFIGYYAWDVPFGWWQVVYEFEGYETTKSGWLPVPPPQLEVNIGMTSYAVPTVTRVNAYEQGIDIAFSKYMRPLTLNTTTISVSKDGSTVVGRIALLNEEENPTMGEGYASKIRFVPDTPFEVGDVVQIEVSQSALSYAGIALAGSFSSTETVKGEPKAIHTGMLELVHGETGNLEVTLEPVGAVAGKRLLITANTPSIAEAKAEVFIDSDGKAIVPITAKLPGKGYFTLTLDGTGLEVLAIVDIKMQTYGEPGEPTGKAATPTATPPGGEVEAGTHVTLSTTTEGAMIHYTTNGEEPGLTTPMYMASMPIVITEDTTIKAIAIKVGMEDSDVLTASYTIDDSSKEPETGKDPVDPGRVPGGGGGGGQLDPATDVEPDDETTDDEMTDEETTDGETADDETTNDKTIEDDGDLPGSAVGVSLTLNQDAPGYISGYPDNTVRAGNNITRYEAAAIFYALTVDQDKASFATEAGKFSDATADQWYSEAIGFLAAKGVISGYPDGAFRGNDPITRAEFVTIASKFGEMKLEPDSPFTDVAEGHWAVDFIKSAYNNDWISGYPDGTFAPNNNITRAEAMVVVNNMLGWDVDAVRDSDAVSGGDAVHDGDAVQDSDAVHDGDAVRDGDAVHNSGTAMPFSDLTGDEWYFKHVLLAVNGS